MRPAASPAPGDTTRRPIAATAAAATAMAATDGSLVTTGLVPNACTSGHMIT